MYLPLDGCPEFHGIMDKSKGFYGYIEGEGKTLIMYQKENWRLISIKVYNFFNVCEESHNVEYL